MVLTDVNVNIENSLTLESDPSIKSQLKTHSIFCMVLLVMQIKQNCLEMQDKV